MQANRAPPPNFSRRLAQGTGARYNKSENRALPRSKTGGFLWRTIRNIAGGSCTSGGGGGSSWRHCCFWGSCWVLWERCGERCTGRRCPTARARPPSSSRLCRAMSGTPSAIRPPASSTSRPVPTAAPRWISGWQLCPNPKRWTKAFSAPPVSSATA